MISFEEFKRLDLRIAQVKSVREHPGADKLYLMQVDLGKEVRQLVAGLRPYYRPEQLEGKKIVVVVNLEPATLRGEKSEGMLLAAQHGEDVVVLVPERDLPAGSPVL